MGVQLANFYKQVSDEFGVPGRVKLAILTKVSSDKAETQADSAESVKLFQHSMDEIRRQMSK